MKNNFLITLFCLCVSFKQINAQVTFKKDYDTSLNGRYSITSLPSGTWIMELTRGINKLDQNGNITFSKTFLSGLLSLGAFDKVENNLIYFDGVFVNGCTVPGTGVMDTNGIILGSTHYFLNGRCSNFTRGSCFNSDYGFSLTGAHSVTEHKGVIDHGFVLRTDSSRNLTWAKYISTPSGGGQFVKQTLDGGFIAGFNFDTCGASLVKLDSLGNVQWSKSYIRPRGYIADGWVNTDGTFLICGLTDSLVVDGGTYPPGLKPALFLMKVDTNGSVLWAKTYDGIDPYHFRVDIFAPIMHATLDGNYVILATKVSAVTHAINQIMIKFDSNGDTLWTNAIGNSDFTEYHLSIAISADSGFFIGGVKYGNFSAPILGAYTLYKTDSLFNSLCSNYKEPILIAPIFPIDSNIVLTFIDGGTIGSGTIGDTLIPTPTYDDCLLTGGTNIHSISKWINAYPNPTTGILTMEVEGHLMSDCYFTVYDYTGRIVFQRTLYTEKEKIEVDLSPYGKGLYLVEFTEKEQVSVKKVVVE